MSSILPLTAEQRGAQRNILLIGTAGAVVACHTVSQLLEEAVFRYPGFKHGLFMTLFLFVFNVVWNLVSDVTFAVLGKSKLGESVPSISRYRKENSLGLLVLVSFLFVCANGLSKLALQYMNVPSQMIFKCLKVVPVMIGSTFVLRKKYSALEYIIAISMVTGASMFTLGDAQTAPRFEPTGIIVICIALCFDALLGNVQEHILKKHVATMVDLMACQAWFGAAYSFFGASASSQLFSGCELILREPRLFALLIAWAIMNLTAIALVLQLVQNFSAVTAVTITLGRKLLSIALSFLIFPKPFTALHAFGVFLVLGSGAAHSYRSQISAFLSRIPLFSSRQHTHHQKLDEENEIGRIAPANDLGVKVV